MAVDRHHGALAGGGIEAGEPGTAVRAAAEVARDALLALGGTLGVTGAVQQFLARWGVVAGQPKAVTRSPAGRLKAMFCAPTASVSRFPLAGVATTIAATPLSVSSAQERGVMVALTA
ncbi:hypothetical protein ACWKT5_24685 [Streptomyces avermitilis]